MSNKKYKGNEISIVFVPLYVFINDIVLNEDKNENGDFDKDKNGKNNLDNKINF